MRQIKYKTISIQNFLSVGNDTVVIDFEKGMNLITGKNIDNPERKNAVGKSVLIEAYYYSLFGQTIRDIKKEFIINNVTKGKGKLELTFDVITDNDSSSYKIVRQIKPSTVELYRCGDVDEDISKDSIANTNKYICELIGSNPVICKSCDILSLSDNIPFMAKKPEEKRKFNDDIFSMEVFGKMSKELKDLVKENKSQVSISSAKIYEIDNSLQTLQKQKDEWIKKIEEKEKILNERKEEICKKIKGVDDELQALEVIDISKIQNQIDKLSDGECKFDIKIDDVSVQLTGFKVKKNNLNSQISKFDSVEGTECSKCLQQIPHTHIETLEVQKKELKEELAEVDTQYQKLIAIGKDLSDKKHLIHVKLTELLAKRNKSERQNSQIDNLKERKVQLEEMLKHVDDDSKEVAGSLELFDKNIEETENRKKTESEILDKLRIEASDLETCKFILSDEGVKSYVIKKLLTILNTSIQKYITDLGMTMRCSFDEYFDEKITNDKGKEISYWNFSGGERRTVDLACAWAFKDLKKKISGISSNLEWMDEILDSAFDSHGLDLLIGVIKDRIDKENLCCYVISHRNETLKHIDGEIVSLEKENGVTRRVEN